jgi:CubicO group peptidase (beta-lactamase class C family)
VIRAVGLDETAFFPAGTGADPAPAFARTEQCPWRGRILDGEVHDDNAWAMGGVAGHAGLFSTARDICTFGAAWLASLDGSGWISRDAAERALTRRPGGRGLGFDAKSPTDSAAGTLCGPRTMGHLGFTGTSIWLDPDRRAVIVLLSNRVHPTRHNEAIRTFRPHFHDVFFGAI